MSSNVLKDIHFVIPAQAGIQRSQLLGMDPRLRGDDAWWSLSFQNDQVNYSTSLSCTEMIQRHSSGNYDG